MISELLDANGLAERLKLRPATILGWARSGRIPSVKISHKCVRFDFEQVVESLRSSTNGSGDGDNTKGPGSANTPAEPGSTGSLAG